MRNNRNKLSVITINYNDFEGLQKTIKSVINQNFKDFEYILIDGGSTDNSVKIIKKYANNINYWISEPDAGIFNAMNKGIEKSSGEYILFMNSGDSFVDNSVLQNIFDLHLTEDYIFGKANLTKNDKIIVPEYITPVTDPTLYDMLFQSLPHAASFIKKSLFEKHGKYNEDLELMGDWAHSIRDIIINNCSIKYIPITICNYDISGISQVNKAAGEIEKRKVLESFFSPRILADYKIMQSYHTDRIRIDWFREHSFFHKLYVFLYKIGRKLQKIKKRTTKLIFLIVKKTY